MCAEFSGCNDSLEFRHIRAGHPPEIIINKNNGCHEMFSPGELTYPGPAQVNYIYGREYQSCASERFCGF